MGYPPRGPREHKTTCGHCHEPFTVTRQYGRPRLYCSRHCASAAKLAQNERVSPEDFVRAWQKAETLPEVAKALGMTEHAAENRAYRYRDQGVRLKHMRKHMDVERLNRIVAEGSAG